MAPLSKRRPIMVVLVGVTGAGKTTFTSVASGRQDLGIGDGLDPCTQDPQAVRLTVDGRPVILIDTPGFDDRDRSDMEILEDIGKWLSRQGFTKHLDGLILLHPITQDFDSNLEKRRTRLLEKILGKDAYKRVVVATTMWGSLANEDEVGSDIRRRWEKGVWYDFYQGGAALTKHFNNIESAHRIIKTIIDRSDEAKGAGVLLQDELARKGARFTDTSLGRELKSILEDDIRLIENQLLLHRRDRPPESYENSQSALERWKWFQWEEEYNDLTKNLELRQMQLQRLNGFIVSKTIISLIHSARRYQC